MFLETVESAGLSHLSYVLGDERAGVGAVIDPRRDVDVYLEIARRKSVRITHILETHIHADFVSGSTELAAQTGAAVVAGVSENYKFPREEAADGREIRIGDLQVRAVATPGHTPEHVCFLVGGGRGAQDPWGLFTGDALFAGEVGRPDLLGAGSERDLARQLHRSLHGKLLPLGDEIEIYPAHGQGSPCGGSIGDRTTSTLGYERRHNARLRIADEEEFARQLLEGLPAAPRYYPRMKALNAQGPPSLRCRLEIHALPPEEFRRHAADPSTLVLDVREIEAFGGAHIPGSLNIPLRDEFPVWAGWMVDPDSRVLLVLSSPADLETVERHLARIGIDNVGGYLQKGMRGWFEKGLPIDSVPQMSVQELRRRLKSNEGLQVLDVRREDEVRCGRIPGATHIFAAFLEEEQEGLDPARPVAAYCGSGFRASIAASVLKRNGFARVSSVPGSMAAWKAAGFETAQSDG